MTFNLVFWFVGGFVVGYVLMQVVLTIWGDKIFAFMDKHFGGK